MLQSYVLARHLAKNLYLPDIVFYFCQLFNISRYREVIFIVGFSLFFFLCNGGPSVDAKCLRGGIR
jgi:hypothetical protein